MRGCIGKMELVENWTILRECLVERYVVRLMRVQLTLIE